MRKRLADLAGMAPQKRQMLRQGLRLPREMWGTLTASMRMKPEFIMIGAQRCGTSALFRYLCGHPHIAPPLHKEIHFFDKAYRQGVEWYLGNFPTHVYASVAGRLRGQGMITGEASPYYLFHPHAPYRVRALLPQVKLIVLLRNPVDRAYSHFHLVRKQGAEHLSFEEAIDSEPERLRGEREKMLEDEHYYSFNHQHYSYASRGIYVDQLAVWMSQFGREQFLLVKSEDFFQQTQAVYTEILTFLGLRPWTLPAYERRRAKSYPPMDARVRGRLVEYFRPHNQRLYQFLGRDFGWDR